MLIQGFIDLVSSFKYFHVEIAKRHFVFLKIKTRITTTTTIIIIIIIIILKIIIIKYIKLPQKEYKSRLGWVGMLIFWELCKRLKLDRADKWYIQKLESVLEIETHKIICYFEIQMDHQIQARRLDLVLTDKKKKNLSYNGFYLPSRPQCEGGRKQKVGQLLQFTRELKKL